LRDGSRLGVIEEIYVQPEARGVGVGELLVERSVAFCVEAGCSGVDAAALPGHRQAKNFFERAGFTARLLVMHRSCDR
jgi:GNAT superfamily N-acetyltransferase